MDMVNRLSRGAQVVLIATIVFLIVSFFNWYEVDLGAAGDFIDVDAGVSMWNGIGVVAGLIAIVLLVWQAVRLANIEFEVGVTPAMITMVLAVLLLLFTLIRVLDGYTGADRTIWLWIGLLAAVVIVVGAYMNMKAAGESFSDMKNTVAGAASSARGSSTPPPDAPASTPAPPPPPVVDESPDPPDTRPSA